MEILILCDNPILTHLKAFRFASPAKRWLITMFFARVVVRQISIKGQPRCIGFQSNPKSVY